VEGVGERDDVAPPRDPPGQLEGRLDRVAAGGAHELQAHRHAARSQDLLRERLEELGLGRRRHVEAVHDAVGLEVGDDRPFHALVVVPEVQDAGPGEEVDVTPPGLVDLARVGRGGEHGGPHPAVAPDPGLPLLEDLHGPDLVSGTAPGQPHAPTHGMSISRSPTTAG
jgi:hypothetical protein